ncbi:hypothetical protein HJFPF1_07398 [Paramyrothecium foliicola]|nr:hypothetical protein HJFPF1_07398 [Paramyrothecium foliicola]
MDLLQQGHFSTCFRRVVAPHDSCRSLKKVCTFTERPKDPNEAKIENLEKELETLKERLQAQSHQISIQPDVVGFVATPVSTHLPQVSMDGRDEEVTQIISEGNQAAMSLETPTNIATFDSSSSQYRGRLNSSIESPAASLLSSSLKRKRSQFEVGDTTPADFVTAGFLSLEQAESYFSAFFEGCDQYVPVFDPRYDTMQSIRARSSLLFSTICTVGCRVVAGTDSQRWRLLNFHNRKMLNAAVTNPAMASLETLQSLLVRACYVSERSLLLAVATRMGLELGFPEAYDYLSNTLVTSGLQDASDPAGDGAALMRKARTWLHLLVLGHIMHVDAGDMPSFKFLSDARRCRILLESPHLTDLDLFLLAQVELNVLRAKINDSISNHTTIINDDDIMDVVRDAKIDLEIWFSDWTRIVDRRKPQLPWLHPNLQVQKCWGETMVLCRVLRAAGVENVDVMSPTQRSVLAMTKEALQRHLDILLQEPRVYLHKLRFAMDFVWAKCAFCYLLLLKLSLLIPHETEQSKHALVEQGGSLLQELTAAGRGASRNSTGRVYLQLLETGINKYRSVLRRESGSAKNSSISNPPDTPPHIPATGTSSSSSEFESFIPEQFVFEWDFPGLSLFSSPTTEAGWLEDLLMGTLTTGEDFFGFGDDCGIMRCKDVGTTNTDIAGLGIVIAFAYQAGVSLILAFWSLLLWKPAMTLFMSGKASLGGPITFLVRCICRSRAKKAVKEPPAFEALDRSTTTTGSRERRRKLFAWYEKHEARWALQKKIIDQLLVNVSDIQTLNGKSLSPPEEPLTGLIQFRTLSLYHMHILYDTSNFTAISICASLVHHYGQNHEKRLSRFMSLILFTGAYFAFAVIYGIRLEEWNDDKPGLCYDASTIAFSDHAHPTIDQVYLGITCSYCLCSLLMCLSCQGAISAQEKPTRARHIWNKVANRHTAEKLAPSIIFIAMLQYPLHLYMVIAMRAVNEPRLTGGSENAWGFGQIVALILTFATILECLRGISDYRKEVAAGALDVSKDLPQLQRRGTV